MVVLVTVALVVVFGAILYARQLADLGAVAARRLHLVRTPGPVPGGRPIEAIAADVVRLRRQARNIPPGTPVARREGWLLAYDDVLTEACLALGVENLLESTPAGPEREAERLRVEYLLGQAGLRALDDVA